MRLVTYQSAHGAGSEPGLLLDRGVVSLASLVSAEFAGDAQAAMVDLIDRFDALRPRLDALAREGQALPVDKVLLLAPLPRPGKLLCATGGGDGSPLLATLKSAESVIGPNATVILPGVDGDWQFQPEAELGLVIRGSAKSVASEHWDSAIFGYTCAVDVMPRGDQQFGRDFWLAKSDTLGPLGPCIVTADAIDDPSTLRVRSSIDGSPAQDYPISALPYSVAELVAFATTVMTLKTGDVLTCGTVADGLRPLRGGERLDVEIESVGRLSVTVAAKD